jgi:histidinol-phosphate aminotransferase
MVVIKKTVKKMDPYVPGRSIQEIATVYGFNPENIIKLGSNENPLGPSPLAIQSVQENLHLMHQYPESNLDDLKLQIASYAGVRPSMVIVGGDGADEILDVLGKTLIELGDEFIIHRPSYMYYEFTFKAHGGVPISAKWDLEKNQLDLQSVLDAISTRTKIIFLCTPNNPTGGLIDKKDIETVLKSTDALVVVDEAYFEFSGVNNVELLEDHENLFILRTFSKVMGLAGMRIGYGIGNEKFIEYMHRVKPVFSLTKLSQIAASATLLDTEYIKKSTEYSIESRKLLYQSMAKLANIKVFESKANYLLVNIRETGIDSKTMTMELMKKGIIVRDCSSFQGLDDYWIRVSVGTIEEDRKFIDVLENIIGRISK